MWTVAVGISDQFAAHSTSCLDVKLLQLVEMIEQREGGVS